MVTSEGAGLGLIGKRHERTFWDDGKGLGYTSMCQTHLMAHLRFIHCTVGNLYMIN